MRVFPAHMHVMLMGLWAQEKDSQVPAGAHLLDNIVVEPHPEHAMREPMKVSFLLPADHGLDPSKTWVGLVQQTIGCLQCLPSRLSEFKSAPLVAPLPLLLPPQLQCGSSAAAAAAAAAGGGARQTALVGTQDSGLSDSADTQQQQQQQQQQQPWTLQLVDLQESTTSYTATIKLAPSSSSSSSSSQPSAVCSGLQAEPVVMVAGEVAAATAKAPSHEVVLSLKQPAGVTSFRLPLLHPVQTSNAEYKLSRSSGTITARLFKSPDPDYPCDLNPPMGLGLLEQLRVDKLSALPASVERFGFWMTEMFTHAENAAKVHDPHGGLGDPFFDLRETLKILLVGSLEGETIYRMTNKEAAPGSKEEAAMYIRVHMPSHRQPNGRPIALVSVVDSDLANKLLKGGKIDQMDEVNRFVDVIHSQISKNNAMRNCICSRRELAPLRALLLRNARRMQQQTEAANGAGSAASMRQAAARSAAATGSRSGPSSSSNAAAAAAAAAGDDRAGAGSSQSCRVCGAKAGGSVTLMRCSCCKAKADWYCSRDCQKADWGRHKKGCTPA